MAREEGFAFAAVAPASVYDAARAAALRASADGRLDGLRWMTPEWLGRSTDPHAFLAGCRSLVVVGLAARPPEPPVPAGGRVRGRVARYAWGRDYHRVFEAQLRRLARRLREEHGCATRVTVDYGPLLERPPAAAGGVGWIGKSTMLLVPGIGPWALLGVVATTLELEPGRPLQKSCGSCIRCAAACPTGALGAEGGMLDARRCISYHTIENRGPIPRDLRANFGDWVFGCDACLDSCPVGRHRFGAAPGLGPATPDAAAPPLADIVALDEGAFAGRFRGRALMRAKRDGLVRNACVALGNAGEEADVEAIIVALWDRSALVRGHAAWALGRMVERGVADARRAADVLGPARAREADPQAREELDAALLSVRGSAGP